MCAYGQNRSPTAALVAQEIVRARNGPDITMTYGCIKPFLEEIASCPGTEFYRERLRNHLKGFDRIFVMEEYMAEGIRNVGINVEERDCLDIPDRYSRNDPELMGKLREKLEKLL